MNSAVQPPLLKLEEAFEDCRRSGTEVQDAVKSATLPRRTSVQLKTYLNLGTHEDMSYSTLREQCLKWDKLSRDGLHWLPVRTLQPVWRSTELKVEASMVQLAKRAKAKAKMTKALQRASQSRRQSQRMEKERPRKVMRKARASSMIDPEGRVGKEE